MDFHTVVVTPEQTTIQRAALSARPLEPFGIDAKESRAAWTRALVYVAVILLLTLVWVSRKTLLLFSTSLLLAYLVYPLVDIIDRKMGGKNRGLAAAIPFAMLLTFSVGFGLLVKEPLQQEYMTLEQQTNKHGFAKEVANWRPLDLPVGEHIVELYKNTELLKMIPAVSTGVQTTLRYSLNSVIIPILSFFILKDGAAIRAGLLEFCDNRERVERFLTDAHILLLEYMRSLLFLCLSVLVTFSLVLSTMRVPYAILLAIVAFCLEFVPMVGPASAALLIIGVSAFDHYPYMQWLALFLFGYRLFQDYVLSPHLMKRGVKLHPLLVLLGVFAGGEIGGVVGIFLSVPTLALLRLAFYEMRKAKGRHLPNSLLANLQS